MTKRYYESASGMITELTDEEFNNKVKQLFTIRTDYPYAVLTIATWCEILGINTIADSLYLCGWRSFNDIGKVNVIVSPFIKDGKPVMHIDYDYKPEYLGELL